jgi:hypothetical protein
MGTADDMAFRIDHRRENDDANIQMLNKAFLEVRKGLSVTGDAVGRHLEDRSLLPVEVSNIHITHWHLALLTKC